MSNNTIIAALTAFTILFNYAGYAVENKAKVKLKSQQKRLKINPMTDYESAWIGNIESDIYRDGTFENVTVGYSALHGWDFSLSLLNAQVLGNNNSFQGNTFINVAKTFDMTNDFAITIGSQNGIALVNVRPQVWFNFSFLDSRYDVAPWVLLHGGPYLANASITGTSRQIGFLTGAEITFIQNKLSIEMDYISGHHALSGANVNMLYNITPRCQIYLGVLVPEQNSGNEFAGIVGVNFSTHNL